MLKGLLDYVAIMTDVEIPLNEEVQEDVQQNQEVL